MKKSVAQNPIEYKERQFADDSVSALELRLDSNLWEIREATNIIREINSPSIKTLYGAVILDLYQEQVAIHNVLRSRRYIPNQNGVAA